MGVLLVEYFETPNGIALLAHRGLVLPGSNTVENTAIAFQAALAAGATHIETDIQVTSDLVAVLHHDDTMQRLTGDSRSLSQVTFAEFREVCQSRGFEPLALRDALAGFPDAKFNLDVKAWRAVSPVASAVNELAAHHRVLVSSFSDSRRLATLSLLDRPVATSAGAETVLKARLSGLSPFRGWLKTTLLGVNALQIPVSMYGIRFATKSFIDQLRTLRVQVHFWTVNSPEQARTLLDLGATGLVSDRVDAIAPLLGKS